MVADREVAGDYVEQITGVPGAKVRICHLSGHGHNLELLQYLAPPGAPRARRLQDVGSAHLCFLTDDLDAQCEWLRERGIRFRSPGRHRPPPPGSDEPLRRLESLRSSSVELQLRLPT